MYRFNARTFAKFLVALAIIVLSLLAARQVIERNHRAQYVGMVQEAATHATLRIADAAKHEVDADSRLSYADWFSKLDAHVIALDERLIALQAGVEPGLLPV